MTGQYSLRKVCLSIPTTLGKAGVIKAHEVELWPKDLAGLQASGRALEDTWSKLS
jgi:L-lactate dehydrogenase